MRRTYADRNQLLGDPAFVSIPLEQLLSGRYMVQRMQGIDADESACSVDEAARELAASTICSSR